MSNARKWPLCLLAFALATLTLAPTRKAPPPSVGEPPPAASDAAPANAPLRPLFVAGRWDEVLKLAKPAALWPDYANGSEGLIQTNTPIVLNWDVCAPRGGTNPAPVLRPLIHRYPWLEFTPASNSLAATLHLKVDSWPKTAWQTRLQQVDRAGAFVVVRQEVVKTLENSGAIETYPFEESLEATFHLETGTESGAPRGALYQISIGTLWTEQGNPLRWGEAMPLALDLPTAEQSRVFKAESLTLTKAGASVQAAVQAEVISWPKSRWRLSLELSGTEGRPVGHAAQVVENIGEIVSRPAWYHPSFQLAVSGAPEALEAAQRWTLRIESLPQERAQDS